MGASEMSMRLSDKQTEKFLRSQLKPIESQRQFAKRFALNRPQILIFSGILFFQGTGLLGRELRELPFYIDAIWTVVRVLLYMGAIYVIYPYSMRFCAVRRIPFFYNIYGVYFFCAVMYSLIFGPYISQFTYIPTYMRLFNSTAVAFPFVILLTYLLGKPAAESLFEDSNLYPVWQRYQMPNLKLLVKLAPENRSAVRYIEAQSPYVLVVTKTGSQTLRMTFNEALEMVPGDVGWKILRSVWVAKSEVAEVRYVDGNPKVVLKDGTQFSTNRAMAPKVKSYLLERHTTAKQPSQFSLNEA